MILNEKETNARLTSSRNLANRFGVKTISTTPEGGVVEVRPARQRMMTNLPPFMKTTVGVLAAQGVPQKQISEEFGIGVGEVGHIKHGNVKSADNDKIAAAMGGARDVAMEKLMLTLGIITSDKLQGCKAPELSKVAADMSRVVANTMPKESGGNAPQINLTIYSPTVKDEKQYKVIDV